MGKVDFEKKSKELRHKIQYITDTYTGHFKISPFNLDIFRENRSREQKVSQIQSVIHQFDKYTDQQLIQKNKELHEKAREIAEKYQANLDKAIESGRTDLANKIRSEIDDEIREKLLVDAFSLVATAVKKEKGFDLHDSQINAALVLCDNNIAEMRCGGGKTIMQFLPAYFNTLTLDHHFIITPNDYLKYEGYIEAKKVFNHLGITVGIMPEDIHQREKVKEESHKDIVYATSASIAHSMLLDRMAKPKDRVLPEKKISTSIDEIDQIVLDNAKTPFVISNSSIKLNGGLEYLAQEFVSSYLTVHLMEGLDEVSDLRDIASNKVYNPKTDEFLVDLIIDPHSRDYRMTDLGDQHLNEFMESVPYFQKLTDHDRELFVTYYVPNAIKAGMMKDGVDYIADKKQGKINVYNSVTGRKVESSVFAAGIQQALEAKEGFQVHEESISGDEMSILDMLRKFDKISGCSGTVRELNDYFEERFGKFVREIPSPPSNAINEAPVYFLTKSAKRKYIVQDIVGRIIHAGYMGDNLKYQSGAPLLIVSSSKEEAQTLYNSLRNSKLENFLRKLQLQKKGIDNQQSNSQNNDEIIHLITADNSDEEMKIFAQSGRMGAVTFSTLMAGRGTDIKLGGAPEQAASAEVCEMFKIKERLNDAKLSEIRANLDSKDAAFFSNPANAKYVLAYQEALQRYMNESKDEKKQVNDLGGLCVISTDFINSERGQRQLLSRAARQNDNGTTVQFVSFEDEGFTGTTLRSTDVKKIEKMLVNAGYDKDTPITPSMGKIYKECQKLVNKCRHNYDANHAISIMKSDPYMDVIQRNGDHFREERDAVFNSNYDPIEVMKIVIQRGIENSVSKYLPDENHNVWDLQGLKNLYLGILVGEDAFNLTSEQLSKITPEMISSSLTQRAFSLLSLDHPEKISPKVIEEMKQNYFNSFNSAIAMFSVDAKGLRSNAFITPQLDQDKKFSLYMDLTQDYFEQMRNGISYDFLARSRGIDLMKLDLYSTNVSLATKREVRTYLRTQSQLKDRKGRQYVTAKEKMVARKKMSLKEYVDQQERNLSKTEVELANLIRMDMLKYDKENAQIYLALKSSSILELASSCKKISQQDFYTMYNTARDTSDTYFGGKLADALYDSGCPSQYLTSIKDKILGKFYQYTIVHDGYRKMQAVSTMQEKVHHSYSQAPINNTETPSFRLK